MTEGSPSSSDAMVLHLTRLLGDDVVLLHCGKGIKGARWKGWQNTTIEMMRDPRYRRTLGKAANLAVLLGASSGGLCTIDIDDELKVRAYHELEKLGITPSELVRQALLYVAQHGQLPFRLTLMNEDDEVLIATVRERLTAPNRVKVALDDL
jgi:RHH-type rel operon transcriptional repressor/antitoxin RelB